MTEFALLFFASLLETGAILRGVQYLVQAAIRISSTVSIDEGDAGEELWSNNRVLACVLFLIQVEEKTKLIEMLAICAGEHFELPQELPIVLLGQVFAPIFLLFFHLIKLLHSTPNPPSILPPSQIISISNILTSIPPSPSVIILKYFVSFNSYLKLFLIFDLEVT